MFLSGNCMDVSFSFSCILGGADSCGVGVLEIGHCRKSSAFLEIRAASKHSGYRGEMYIFISKSD